MRNLKIYKVSAIIIAILALTILSCKENNTSKTEEKQDHHSEMGLKENHSSHDIEQTTEIKFKDAKTAEIFQHYIHIKTALVNTDANKAKTGAQMLAKVTENAVFKLAVESILNTDDIDAQRKAFTEVTTQMETLLNGALSSGEVYKQYCPMAFDNTGAYWLSKEKEIRNPYFGDRMLKCGSVAKTIK
jgi:major membrane immunogen (membrane-anchored lipoprotein)